MRKAIKSLFSVLAIGVFIFFAMASESIDGSTNTTVAIRDCMEKPPVSGMVHVEVLYTFNGVPTATNGQMFLIHQKVDADTTCSYTVLADQMLAFNTGADGKFVYDGVPFTHNNSEDLYRIEILIPQPWSQFGSPPPLRETQAKKYSDANFNFVMDGMGSL